MESRSNDRDWKRPPLVGRRLVWTVAGLAIGLVAMHYGAVEWDHWLRRGLGR